MYVGDKFSWEIHADNLRSRLQSKDCVFFTLAEGVWR